MKTKNFSVGLTSGDVEQFLTHLWRLKMMNKMDMVNPEYNKKKLISIFYDIWTETDVFLWVLSAYNDFVINNIAEIESTFLK